MTIGREVWLKTDPKPVGPRALWRNSGSSNLRFTSILFPFSGAYVVFSNKQTNKQTKTKKITKQSWLQGKEYKYKNNQMWNLYM